MRIALVGFGNVGRALARLLLRTGAPFTVTALVTRSHGAVVHAGGIDLATILAGTDLPRAGMAGDRRTHGDFDPGMPWSPPRIGALPADVLVEMTPLDPSSGEPALSYIKEALSAGMHVVTANKGPIAHAYRELEALATERGRVLRFEATLADCLPVFTLRRAALPLARIAAIRGIVSSTNNYILSQCAGGASFAAALADAQRLGIAEADPRNDLEGHDAAAKATILANVLMGANIRPNSVSRVPVDESTGERAKGAARDGSRIRPIITVRRTDGGIAASFAPERVEPADPLYAVDGFSMGVVFDTDLAGRVAVQLHDPHVDQVAYAILTDLLEIAGHVAAGGGAKIPPP
jgi:homoserine dehydrogenase